MGDVKPFSGAWSPTDEARDRGLLAAIAARDRDAFEAFYARHAADVFRFVRDLVRDEGIAEELTSDVMVQVWRSAATYGGRSRVRTWLFGVAHHKTIDALRRRRTATVTLDDVLSAASAAEGPEALALRAADTRRLEVALATLSPEHRAVLELTFIEGFSQKEIAEIVNAPVATVKTRTFYAKQRLRDALAAAEEPR